MLSQAQTKNSVVLTKLINGVALENDENERCGPDPEPDDELSLDDEPSPEDEPDFDSELEPDDELDDESEPDPGPKLDAELEIESEPDSVPESGAGEGDKSRLAEPCAVGLDVPLLL